MIVRVGLPSFRESVTCPSCGKKGTWPRQTYETIAALKAYDKSKIDFQVVTVSGTHCMRGRNITSQARPTDSMSPVKQILPYDYYLATDDDMAFSPMSIERLIALNLDIVGAAYMTRTGPDAHLIVACPVDKSSKPDWFKVWDSGVQECKWTGGGCLLIKKSVFEAMSYPWWRNNVVTETVDGVVYGDIQTEDVSFCQDARAAGFKVFVDLDNRIAHIPT